MRAYELIVFDWDGTLMDSISSICHCLAYAFEASGLTRLSDEEYKGIIGLGLKEAMIRLAPEAGEEMQALIVENYKRCFMATSPESMPLYEGAEALLAKLHDQGYQLAVATGKSRRGLDHVFHVHPIGAYFHATRCADESQSKPAPDMLLELMEVLAVAPEKTMMIGDSAHDMGMARSAGVHAIGIAHGAMDEQMLRQHGASHCAQDLDDLHGWFVEQGLLQEVN